MRARSLAAAGGSVALLAALLGGCTSDPSSGGAPEDFAPAVREVDGHTAANEFLATYVEEDGRVVRTDQGGDTVSEGQAYALLIALGAGDRATFDEVWDWTQSNLLRDDGLLSWRWADGAVVDESAATDADLDAARALVLAGEQFGEPTWIEDGIALGDAVLEHATIDTPAGRVVVAGEWATAEPHWFNPSYVSPATTDILGEASGDDRWEEVEVGSRAALDTLILGGQLPPDWAHTDPDGTAYPVGGPGGEPVQFGYDAARTLLRHAESCAPEDRRVAADLGDLLGDGDVVATYDLGGGPTSADRSPLMTTAQAASMAADGDSDAARYTLSLAIDIAEETPSYYGDAWAALAPMLLGDPVLGGCPPLAERA